MDHIEVKIYTNTEGIDVLTGVLTDLGISGFVVEDPQDFEEFLEGTQTYWDYVDESLMELREAEPCIKFYVTDDLAGAEQLAAVRTTVQAIQEREQGRLGRLSVQSEAVVHEADWANNWKQYFKPLEVGERFLIKPSWEQVDDPKGRLVIEIDPASSFGTGSHATTQLCIRELESAVCKGDAVLDMGSGSGILSIAAMLLGASDVTAFDLDPGAVKIAQENLAHNAVPGCRYTVLCGDVLTDEGLIDQISQQRYDVIAANIVSDVLIAIAPLFGKLLKPGGRLLVSGIITEREGEVAAAIEETGLLLDHIEQLSGWSMVAAHRQAPSEK